MSSLPRMASAAFVVPRIDGPAFLGALENGRAIAADDFCGEVPFLEREAERASDQAGSDDRDLAESHGEKVVGRSLFAVRGSSFALRNSRKRASNC
jgi:hypothetical protein